MPRTKTKPKLARPPLDLPPGCPSLLSREQVCRAIGVCQRLFDGWVAKGEFPRADVRLGKLPRWKPETLRAWIDARCVAKG